MEAVEERKKENEEEWKWKKRRSQATIFRSAENDTPIYLKSLTEIKTALKNTTPVLSTAITTTSQIKDKVYYCLTHKEEERAMREAVEVWGGFSTLSVHAWDGTHWDSLGPLVGARQGCGNSAEVCHSDLLPCYYYCTS
ncbi:uncharacterized protein LOC123506776 [Portunus trituberculatus]|uniref:uncharacterized protein LOC123506776 n=1 Tax=Portunus trituberculatus TaxID=210409 RepID=UPI001E1CE3CD|nr:uncharacterized protein LOC123506776 [Portunus trituberculatus]